MFVRVPICVRAVTAMMEIRKAIMPYSTGTEPLLLRRNDQNLQLILLMGNTVAEESFRFG